MDSPSDHRLCYIGIVPIFSARYPLETIFKQKKFSVWFNEASLSLNKIVAARLLKIREIDKTDLLCNSLETKWPKFLASERKA